MPRALIYFRLMRLHQPVGIWLLLWPCWWSLALATESRPLIFVLFALGSVVMRSAGCIINDMWDRKVDGHVERTKHRPLASGEISMRQATILLAALLAVALIIAALLGTQVMLWAALSLPLIVAYPLMKRITWWPQVFLGLTFNWGALVASVATHGEVTSASLLLYTGCIFWTLVYDTIYAHQDKIDDAKIGVKSAALKLGGFTKSFVLACYAVFSLCLFLAVQPEKWSLVLYICAVLHMVWQVWAVKLEIPASCKKIFASNARIGWLIFASIAANYLQYAV